MKPQNVEDGMYVSFDELPTEKGYSAEHIELLTCHEKQSIQHNDTHLKYTIPSEIYISKKSTVKGWETIEKSDWKIVSTDRDLDRAKSSAKDLTEKLGGNALVDYSYDTSTGSESGTGSGTHNFTIHHFSGRVINIAKKSITGEYDKTDFDSINEIAAKYWLKETKKTGKSIRHGFYALFVALLISVYAYFYTFPTVDIHFFGHLFEELKQPDKRYWFTSLMIFVFLAFIIRKLWFNFYNDWLEPCN